MAHCSAHFHWLFAGHFPLWADFLSLCICSCLFICLFVIHSHGAPPFRPFFAFDLCCLCNSQRLLKSNNKNLAFGHNTFAFTDLAFHSSAICGGVFHCKAIKNANHCQQSFAPPMPCTALCVFCPVCNTQQVSTLDMWVTCVAAFLPFTLPLLYDDNKSRKNEKQKFKKKTTLQSNCLSI